MERGSRTGLGIYPPSYSTSQYPPLYFAPISATHLNAFSNTHGDVHKELLSDPIKKNFQKIRKERNNHKLKINVLIVSIYIWIFYDSYNYHQ